VLEIERAGVKDHGVVTALLINFARSEGWTPEVDRDRWDRVIAELLHSDKWLFLQAMDDGEPVGLAVVNFSLTLYGSREQARMTALIVDEEFRRRGVGGRLMEEVLASVRRRGCRELEVNVAPDENILGFYKRFNYTGQRTLLTWRGTG
jgi:ribosomal protein S18 acetylase RimI-like enzyme